MTTTCARSSGSQHTLRREAAPADVPPSSALLLDVGLPSVRAPSDPLEVCLVSHGRLLRTRTPYPLHYRTAFASSSVLYPQHHQHTLRLPTHAGVLRAYRVPLGEYRWGRSALSAGEVVCP